MNYRNKNEVFLSDSRAGSRKSFVQFCEGYDMNSPHPTLFREKSINYELNDQKVYTPFWLLPDRLAAQLVPNIVDEIEYELIVLE